MAGAGRMHPRAERSASNGQNLQRREDGYRGYGHAQRDQSADLLGPWSAHDHESLPFQDALMLGGKELAPPGRRRTGRVLAALLAAFAGLTAGSIVSALLVPGDFFDLFQPGVIVCVGVGSLLGAYAGFHVRARWQEVLIAVMVGLSILYWVAAPNGWWATRPPPMRAPITAPE